MMKKIISSKDYLKRLAKDHALSPSNLSIFSYSNHSISNLTHTNIPFEKRLYSLISKIKFIIGLFIIRKSLTPLTISISDNLSMIS